MTTPTISFIIPCYNYGCYLADCLNSIFQQEGHFDFEVIVIDDGSTDSTQSVLKTFQDPRIRIFIHTENQGLIKTITECLMSARGKFIARIDPDDRYRSNFLLSVMEKFNRYPEVALVYGDAALINAKGKITVTRTDIDHNNSDFKGNELVKLMEKNFICAPTMIARAEAWLDTLPLPEKLVFDDWYFTLMMARKHEFYYINHVLADYRVHHQNHHHKIILNKTEEPSIFWLLDKIFNSEEKNLDLEYQKQLAKLKIYSTQYLDCATKYFGCGHYQDARRCYIQAFKYAPMSFDITMLRRIIATFFDKRSYEFIKKILKHNRIVP